MTIDELKVRLNQLEWRDIEFKEATFAIPAAAHLTVSAFANTSGGWLVFGVQSKGGKFEIKGVANPDELQNGFIGTLRQKNKFSCAIAFKEDKLHDAGNTVLIFYIPEVPRTSKPVFIDGRMDQTYVRKGGTTQQCNKYEIEAFIRDAAQERFEDGTLEKLDVGTCFDVESLKWYRRLFHERQSGHETEAKEDIAFLEHFGLVLPINHTLRPTRAAVLLFGTNASIHHFLPRQIVDLLIFQCKYSELLPEQRWDERIEALSEGNIIKAWQRIVEVYRSRFAESRFELDNTTMQRKGAPPDYLAFREAVLNLLIHQDYGDHTRKARITLFADEYQFWNPGASFVCGEEFFKAGDKPVRNTRLRAMLTRVGIGEQANTGIRNIFAHQRSLGRIPPVINNSPAEHFFAVTLSKLRLVSQNQQILLKKVGVSLTDPQAALFIHALGQGEVRPLEAQSVCGLAFKETSETLNHLIVQMLLEKHTDPTGDVYRPVPVFLKTLSQAGGLPAAESTAPGELAKPGIEVAKIDQPNPSLVTLPPATESPEIARPTATSIAIMEFCRGVGRGVPAIMDKIGVSHRSHFKANTLDIMVEAGWLRQLYPETPRHPDQGYATTDKGVAILNELSTGHGVAPNDSLVTDRATKPDVGKNL